MTTTTTRAYYAESRERLVAITSDEALLAAFDLQAKYDLAGDSQSEDRERVARWDAALGDFLGEMVRLRLSLDYVFGGKGEPFLPPLPGIMECEITSDFLRLPEEMQHVFAAFVKGLADYERRQKIIRHKPKPDDRA